MTSLIPEELHGHRNAMRRARRVSATILRFVSDPQQAKHFLVFGSVQGVGFRYFTTGVAERLLLSGYVRNMPDGCVEVYAIGTSGQLAALRSELERGPRFCSVDHVVEEDAPIDPKYVKEFTIIYYAG